MSIRRPWSVNFSQLCVEAAVEFMCVRRMSRVRSKIFGGSVQDIVPEFEFIFRRTVQDINFER